MKRRDTRQDGSTTIFKYADFSTSTSTSLIPLELRFHSVSSELRIALSQSVKSAFPCNPSCTRDSPYIRQRINHCIRETSYDPFPKEFTINGTGSST